MITDTDPWSAESPTGPMDGLNRAVAVDRLRARSVVSEVESFRGSPCLLWTGHVDDEGYPNKVQVEGFVTSAHRLSYQVANGAIPKGLQIDHLCHDPAVCPPSSACPHRRCVNPRHLEAVTPRENTLRSGGRAATNARMDLCAHGHPWDKVHASGRRRCSVCEHRLARDEYRQRSQEQRQERAARRRALDEADGRRARRNRAATLAKHGLKPDECVNGHAYVDGSFRLGATGRRICLRCRVDAAGR